VCDKRVFEVIGGFIPKRSIGTHPNTRHARAMLSLDSRLRLVFTEMIVIDSQLALHGVSPELFQSQESTVKLMLRILGRTPGQQPRILK